MRELLKRGDIVANSFAFTIAEERIDQSGDIPHREIEKVERLFDISLVTRPAYKEAVVTSRSMKELKKETPSAVSHRKQIIELRKLKINLLK